MTREEAIKKLKLYSKLMHRMCDEDELTKAIDIILVDINKQWISVDEMLPEENGEYLVCTEHDIRTICYYSANLKLFVGTMLHNMRVTHWMPMTPLPSGDKL